MNTGFVSKLLGYVIASEYGDYLGAFIETREKIHKAWVSTPLEARLIPTKFQAIELLKKLELHYSAFVVELWEEESRLVVVWEDEN